MKHPFFPVLVMGGILFFGCTAIPDAGTRVYVNDRMTGIQLGNAPEQVQSILDGPPHMVSVMQQGPDSYELWEYRVGNFLYAETAMILFKNDRVFALPRSGQELIKILNSAGIIPQAQFRSHSENNRS